MRFIHWRCLRWKRLEATRLKCSLSCYVTFCRFRPCNSVQQQRIHVYSSGYTILRRASGAPGQIYV